MTPAPATVSLPTPREMKRAPKSARRDATVLEAPGLNDVSLEVDAYLLCVRVRAVGGVTADAMEQCIAKLVRSYQERLRDERLAATTLVPPAPESIEAASADFTESHLPSCALFTDPMRGECDCEQHDMGCECPECFPVDEDDHYCADEGHQVLVDSRGYLGVPSALGGW